MLSERTRPSAEKLPSNCQTELYAVTQVRHNMLTVKWLPRMDSNHDKVIQSHLCYRYTTRQKKISHHPCYWIASGVFLQSLVKSMAYFTARSYKIIFAKASADTAASYQSSALRVSSFLGTPWPFR
jgi:hypothetical protein